MPTKKIIIIIKIYILRQLPAPHLFSSANGLKKFCVQGILFLEV